MLFVHHAAKNGQQRGRSKREDIAIPLDQSGTGIGQVLAMLYVAVHSPFPRVIAIDEFVPCIDRWQ